MKMKNLIRTVILFLLVSAQLLLSSGCVRRRTIRPEVTTEDAVSGESESLNLESFPESEEEMAELWRSIVSDKKYKIDNVTLVNLLQEDVRSNLSITYYVTTEDKQSISELLDIMNISSLAFEKVSSKDIKGYSRYQEQNVVTLNLSVFFCGTVQKNDPGFFTTVINSKFGFSIDLDGYIVIHSPIDNDYTYRSVTPIADDDITLFYKKLRNQK